MKKIPTLFERVYEDHKIVGIRPEFTNLKCAAAFYFGFPTIKYDGSCCAIIEGKFYKRYDAKKGKMVPENAIKCQPLPDPITGHMPCWVPVDKDNPADKWFIEAYNSGEGKYEDGTYEAIGTHFQGNPYGYNNIDRLVRHGEDIVLDFLPPMPTTAMLTDDHCIDALDYTRKVLNNFTHEGIVFWLNDEPVCKIKRTDFGLDWPLK